MHLYITILLQQVFIITIVHNVDHTLTHTLSHTHIEHMWLMWLFKVRKQECSRVPEQDFQTKIKLVRVIIIYLEESAKTGLFVFLSLQ